MKELLKNTFEKLDFDYRIKILKDKIIVFWSNENQWSIASIDFDNQEKLNFVIKRISI